MCISIPILVGINLSRTGRKFHLWPVKKILTSSKKKNNHLSAEGLVGFTKFIQGQCNPDSGRSYKFLVATFTFTAAYDTSQSSSSSHLMFQKNLIIEIKQLSSCSCWSKGYQLVIQLPPPLRFFLQLIYQFTASKTVDSHLFKTVYGDGEVSFTWSFIVYIIYTIIGVTFYAYIFGM
jgi:hypothetical protein